MKRTIYCLCAVALFFLTGCEALLPVDPDASQEGDLILKIEPNLLAFTKATDVAFESTDSIGVSVLVPEWDDDKALYAHNVKYTCSKAGVMETDTPVFWYDDKEQRAFIMSYYPYSADYDIFDEWVFTVNADQSNHYLYTASDLMFACQAAKPTSDAVKLTYTHMLSKVVVYIDNLLDEQIADVFLSDVYGSARVDVGTDGPAEYSVTGSKGTVKMCPAEDADGKALWAAIIVPQSDSDLKLIVTTASQKQYTFTLSEPVSFEAGTRSTSTIVLEGSSVSTTFTPEISDWLPGNDLNFGQNNDDVDEPIQQFEKKLYYSTCYMDLDNEKGAGILWCKDTVMFLTFPSGASYGGASGVVRDRSGNIIVGGFCDGADGEWNAVTWVAGTSEPGVRNDSSEELIIIDLDITSYGEIVQCRYGGEPEYYLIGEKRVEHPQGFCPTSVHVSGEDIYFSGYITDAEDWDPTAAYTFNGELIVLEDADYVDYITVYDGHVFAAGTASIQAEAGFDVNYDGLVNEYDIIDKNVAVLWIDGKMRRLLPLYEGRNDVGGLFVDSSGVYVTICTEEADLFLWKDDTIMEIPLDAGCTWVSACDMYVLDDVVYIGGYQEYDSTKFCGPAIWSYNMKHSTVDCNLLKRNSIGERGRFYFG